MATVQPLHILKSMTHDVGPVAAMERLGIVMEPLAGEPTEAWGVLNPAVARGRDGSLYLFARVVAEGNYSRIGMARVMADAAGRPVGVERLGIALEPTAPYERRQDGQDGCEDPRITFVPALDCYVMAYTAHGPAGARVALAVSLDLFTWERLGLVEFGEQDGIDFDGFDNKDAFFFPEPVIAPDGALSFACMHRPMTGVDHAGSDAPLADLPASIWVSYVPVADVLADRAALLRLRQHELVVRPAAEWEQIKVGGGTPPVLTEAGWLLLYHGIQDMAAPGEPRRLRYSAGALLLDRSDLSRVLWRSPEPLLRPETEEELSGVVNNVVFPTGIDLVDERVVDVYYGMADARIGVARIWLREEESAAGNVDAA